MPPTRYFTPSEVAAHNVPSDCWISYLGKVYDLSPLCDQFSGDILLKPIVASSGKDISHWFNEETKDLKTHVDIITGCIFPYTPMGRFVHVPPSCPRSDWPNNFGIPWWKDEKYLVGVLSKKTRHIRIINTLTLQEQTVEVCAEETMNDILKRYLPYNSHASSYTWKYFGNNLDMNKTLLENGINDESEDFFELRMDEDEFLPPISLYFNDDLTES
ncbi:cytochrome b5 domain-containing protein 1-like [Halichondria panicea]|uniref:cytochrome b5 domain-containing protein 1-like n=1 Tax=Halichondria panicea TaxID=6063 RepID=UPI00312B9639